MTFTWLSINDAADRLRLSPLTVLAMAVDGELHSRLATDHREVCAGAVAAWREQSRPSYRGGPEIGFEAEDEYRREQDT
ncbi:hypothetical protein [Nonomuraea sp. WAC 01424]|uniref:hypothetical protein n=1 Tax=Nonomuraea sp. WAC 01424 TaxID=2203200 RepID=UPI00163BC0A5|nr:hypothetical protein [Nonomuraea sp. WAC 01424]